MTASTRPPFDQILQGDCVAALKGLSDGCVDLVFADPPFNIGYEYDVYHDRRATDDYLDWTLSWGREVQRVLKPDGTFWLAIGDEFAAEMKVLFHRELQFQLRNWVIWYYTFGVHCSKKFARSHAHLFYFVKNAHQFTFHDQEIRVPSARQLIYADRRANPAGRLPDDTWILRPQDVPEGFSPEEDTWHVPRVCGTFRERAGWHGCQMPERLLGRIVEACSSPGELVLDPFAGSGTTPAVAKKLGRQFLGIELSEDYATRARIRVDQIQRGDKLEGLEDPHVVTKPRRSRSSKKSKSTGTDTLF